MDIVGERRIGRFTVDHNFLRHSPEDVMKVLAEVLVVRAESLFTINGIEYMGFSKHFDPAEDSGVPPFYTPYLLTHEDGTVTFEGFRKFMEPNRENLG